MPRRTTWKMPITARVGVIASTAKPPIVITGRMASANATPRVSTMRPVKKSWKTSATVFTPKLMFEKNTVCAARSVRSCATIAACCE